MMMHEIISKYFEGRLTPDEKRFLFEKIGTDHAWKKEFVSMQNLYGLTSWIPASSDEANAIGKLLEFKQKRKNETRSIPWRHLFGYTAAIFISACCTCTVFYTYNWKEKGQLEKLAALEDAQISYEEFTAPPGQRALVKLHDGTTVWLNAHTTLRYPSRFTKNERRVELNGEAFFDVTENKKQPFIVSTEKLNIKVTGTSFNVFAYQNQPEFNTSLLEGSVSIYQKEDESNVMILNPNERAVLSGNILSKQPFKQMDFLLWKDGIYAFDDLPFKTIIKKLELYYDVRIIVNNAALENYKFSGKFRQRDGVESVLNTLRKIQTFRYVKDDEQNVITIR